MTKSQERAFLAEAMKSFTGEVEKVASFRRGRKSYMRIRPMKVGVSFQMRVREVASFEEIKNGHI